MEKKDAGTLEHQLRVDGPRQAVVRHEEDLGRLLRVLPAGDALTPGPLALLGGPARATWSQQLVSLYHGWKEAWKAKSGALSFFPGLRRLYSAFQQ